MQVVVGYGFDTYQQMGADLVNRGHRSSAFSLEDIFVETLGDNAMAGKAPPVARPAADSG